MQKIKNIEFLRVLGCLSVILVHLFCNSKLHGLFPDIEIYNKLSTMTSNGQKAVDLFFMLSGFFFAWKLDIMQTSWIFIKNKLIRLYPLLVFIIALLFIFSLFGTVKFMLYDNILSLLCINGTGLVMKNGNVGHFWYVSAMLWILFLFFYLRKNYERKTVNLIIAILVMFSYTFIIHANKGRIDYHTLTFSHIFNIGMLRAFGGIGAGYFIGEWYKENTEKIKHWKLSIMQTVIISGLEFVCLYFIINNLMLHKLQYNNHIIFIAAFICIIVLFLLGKGLFSKHLNHDIFPKIAKYSYSIYMIHWPILEHLKGSVWKNNAEYVYAHPILNVVFTLALIVISGILTYHFVEAPCANYLKKRAETRMAVGGG